MVRALDLKSGNPRFKSSPLTLNWICFSILPSATPPLRLVNSQLVCLQPVWIFNNLNSTQYIWVFSISLCIYTVPN